MILDKPLKIAIGADHAGFEYKEHIKLFFEDINFADFGTYSSEAVDYADFAHPVASAVENKAFDYGILICGSANGVAITANKHQQIRAAICWNEELAALARKHNDANIICIPARFTDIETAKNMVSAFLTTTFEGGRHATRINKISCQ